MEMECCLTFRPKAEILLRNSKLALGIDTGIWDREKVLSQNSKYYAELAFKNHNSGSSEDRHLTKSRLFWKPRLECVGHDIKDVSSAEWSGV